MTINLADLSVSIAVVVGVVEALKQIKVLAKYAPLLSIVLGVVAAFVFPDASISLTIFKGVIIGLSAAGLYSGTKKVVEEKAYWPMEETKDTSANNQT
jgi:hypothetical protein